MEGYRLITDPFIGTKGFILIQSLQSQLNVRNFQKNLLIAHPEESSATFETEDKAEENHNISYLNIFKEVTCHKNRLANLPVAITCEVGNKKYILSVEGDSVIFKEGELPETIPSETNEFIFYQKDLGNDLISLESSLKKGFYLASSEDGQNLILKSYSIGDKTTKFYFDGKLLSVEFVSTIKSDIPIIKSNFRNILRDLLIANPTDSIATFKSDGHPEAEQAVFYLSRYACNDTSSNALPVAISCHVGEKNYILCVQSNSVILKEGNLPEEISKNTSEYIFFATDFSDAQPDKNLLKFESSSERKCFLGWQTTDPEKKLILKKEINGIDETKCLIREEKKT